MKYWPPTWETLVAEEKEVWAMDFCNVIDCYLFQITILGIIDIKTHELISLSVTLNPDRQWIIQQIKNIAIKEIKIKFLNDSMQIFF